MSKNKRIYIWLTTATILSIVLLAVSMVLWTELNNWIIFVIVTPIFVFLFIYTIIFYIKHVKFLCPHCSKIFKPKASCIIMAIHTPTKRRLKCPKCNKVSWCKDYIE